ncbi:MAG TPA: hypothetical protein ENJ26_04320 [Rhodobacteraceae bacterium]|nr:hypothetical protein [Paracoccaceae bacterium]
MTGFSWIWMLIWAALLVIPFWRILPRSGIPSWVAVFAVVPIGAMILLWIVAFKDDLPASSDGA